MFAAGVALFPTADTPDHRGFASTLHAASAVLFFMCIAYVSLFRSQDTLRLLPDSLRAAYARRYFWTGVALITSPLAAVVLSFAMEPASRFRTLVFWLESLAVWSFAAYWIVKTLEMRESDAEKRALNAELERRPVAETLAKQPGRSITVERVVPAARKPPM